MWKDKAGMCGKPLLNVKHNQKNCLIDVLWCDLISFRGYYIRVALFLHQRGHNGDGFGSLFVNKSF